MTIATPKKWLILTGSAFVIAAAVIIIALAGPSCSCGPVEPRKSPMINGAVQPGRVITASTGTWNTPRLLFAYHWWRCRTDRRRCAQISGAETNTYTVMASDVGYTFDIVVSATAHDGRRASARSTMIPVARTAGIGAPGPSVTCATTLELGGNVEGALQSAAPVSTVCLSGGTWPDPRFSGLDPSGNVTLAAAPGQVVEMAGMTLGAPGGVSNLTVEGIHFTDGVRGTDAINGNLGFQYNTLEDIPDYAFYFYGNGNGGDQKQTGVTIRYNQIDHVSECLESLNDSAATASLFDFDHNVCGPGIGYGQATADSDGGQYIQIGGWNTGTIDNNAFEGPADPSNARLGRHFNVIHGNGGSADLDISRNIFWHTDPLPSNVRLQSGPQNNITIDNNLEVGAIGEEGSNVPEGFVVNSVHGLQFAHNTVVNAFWGATYIGAPCTDQPDCYPTSTNMTGEYNISVPVMGPGSKPQLLGLGVLERLHNRSQRVR